MKIAVYCNNANTLGHSMRLLALFKGIKNNIPGSQMVLLEGGASPMALPLEDYAKVVKLPHALDWTGKLLQKASARRVSVERMFRDRLDRLRAVLQEFRPDIFLVDHFPFGQGPWAFEMTYWLDHVKAKVGCKIVCSVGYLNYAERVYENVDKYFDRILVHSPRRLALTYLKQLDQKSAHELRRVLRTFRDKIDFTGFVFDPTPPSGVERLRDEVKKKGFDKMILVCRGGGAWNESLIPTMLLSAHQKKEWWFVVCCGPATTLKEMQRYRTLARKSGNVRLLHFLPPGEFDRYLAAADLCVSLSGYHTALKLMYFHKRAVLVPHDISEQQWRAKMLLDYIPAVVLPGKIATAHRLGVAMAAALNKSSPGKSVPAAWFDGAAQTTRVLACLD